MRRWLFLGVAMAAALLTGCQSNRVTWAIAVHGGAGTIDPNTPAEQAASYRASLARALEEGRARLARGDGALDTCEAVVRILEDDPNFNAGKGATLTEAGRAELDASIMDGSTLRCGAVGGVTTVKNPISLARLVMERTEHVLLVAEGAERFADATGVERVENAYFVTPRRKEALEKALRERKVGMGAGAASAYGTVGCVALDSNGRLAAATSTGGRTGKMPGRIGDTPLPGAGNYADGVAAVSGTGTGEEFIRHAVARTIPARMELAGETLAQAADHVVFRTLREGDGGVIAVDGKGRIAMAYNSLGMYRGAADSAGRFEVRIWKD
ncbi:MAG: isoaspartyl peptidase/L-asparaginase [Phycisphaerae bacterium]|nr:isoaspartyl peptidase/L-asparaginase [Phycisphaerae bacterium]